MVLLILLYSTRPEKNYPRSFSYRPDQLALIKSRSQTESDIPVTCNVLKKLIFQKKVLFAYVGGL